MRFDLLIASIFIKGSRFFRTELYEVRNLFFQNLNLFEDYLDVFGVWIVFGRFLMEPSGKTPDDRKRVPKFMGYPIRHFTHCGQPFGPYWSS